MPVGRPPPEAEAAAPVAAGTPDSVAGGLDPSLEVARPMRCPGGFEPPDDEPPTAAAPCVVEPLALVVVAVAVGTGMARMELRFSDSGRGVSGSDGAEAVGGGGSTPIAG